jgi:hypothetical protein
MGCACSKQDEVVGTKRKAIRMSNQQNNPEMGGDGPDNRNTRQGVQTTRQINPTNINIRRVETQIRPPEQVIPLQSEIYLQSKTDQNFNYAEIGKSNKTNYRGCICR